MFYLSKFLPLFLYPLGLSFLFLIAVILIDLWHRRWTLQTSLAFSALTLLWIGGHHEVAHRLSHSLEKRNPPLERISANKAEVIVVLGGGVRPEISPRQMPEFNERGDRVLHAVQLYRAGLAPHILATGGYPSLFLGEHSRSEADEMAYLLTFMGIPEERIWLEETSENTFENARNVSAMLREKGINKVILCTSAIHMPRAMAAFEKQGIEVLPAPADFYVTSTVDPDEAGSGIKLSLFYSFPQASYMQVTTESVKEYIGLLYYRLQGWI